MNIKLAVAKVIATVRHEGVASAFRKVLVEFRRGTTDDFDRKHGTDTAKIEQLWNLKIESSNARFGRRYEAIDEQALLDFVAFLGEDLRTFTFIDLGCGKGRPLLIASRLGFMRIIGVEFAGELVQIARANLAKVKIANAVVEHADAADYQFPDGDLIVFLNNPFRKEIVEKVVANLRISRAKKLYVGYQTPLSAEVLDSSDFLERCGWPPERSNMLVWKGNKLNEDGMASKNFDPGLVAST